MLNAHTRSVNTSIKLQQQLLDIIFLCYVKISVLKSI